MILHPQRLLTLSRRAYHVWREKGIQGITLKVRRKLRQRRTGNYLNTEYIVWTEDYDTLMNADRKAIKARIASLDYKPLISVVMPVYNVEEIWLRQAIESVRKQLYPHWELCIADDYSTKPHVRTVLQEYASKDPRIKVTFRQENGHISAASNSALELATGEFIALLDHDDELAEHALYMVVEELNEHPEADLIYSDEDVIGTQGQRLFPLFKSEWNPDLFYSINLVTHLGVYRSSIIRELGGFRLGYEGSQDYDLVLRIIERIPESHIRHIPHILYHWRAVPGSVALDMSEKKYAHEAARKAISAHFERRGISAKVVAGSKDYIHRVIYPLPALHPLVSLIIGTRDRVDLLRQVVEGILEQTDYQPIELIIVDNQSAEPATLEFLSEIQKDLRVKVIKYDAPFNFSAINNMAIRQSRGEVVGLINNDIKIISPDWLKELVSHAIRPEIGAVGAKLYYGDDLIQHAGVVLGPLYIALHVHKYLPKQYADSVDRVQIMQNYSAVTGACLMLRRQVFDEVGGLDEVNLPIAFNDIDLCLRIRERGYRILWTPYAELYHLESASRGSDETPEKLPRFRKEQDYMRRRWKHLLSHDPYLNPNLALDSGHLPLTFPPRVSKPWENKTC